MVEHTTGIFNEIGLFASFDIKTALKWIPGHTGVRGSEHA